MISPKYFCKDCVPCCVWPLKSLSLSLYSATILTEISLNARAEQTNTFPSICRSTLCQGTPSTLSQACTEPRGQSEVKAQCILKSFLSIHHALGMHGFLNFPGYMTAFICSNLLSFCSQALGGLLYVLTVILCPRDLRFVSLACMFLSNTNCFYVLIPQLGETDEHFMFVLQVTFGQNRHARSFVNKLYCAPS